MINQEKTKFKRIVDDSFTLANNIALHRIENELIARNIFVRDSVNKNKYYIHETRERWLGTPYGDIRFSRTIFKNRETGKKVYLVDQSLGLQPYGYVQPVFFEMFISNISEIKSYKSLSKMFGDRFSSIQITRIIDRFDFNLKPKQLQDKTKILFINLDGVGLHQHKGIKKEFKFAVCYTGSTKEKRPKLLNKVILPFKPGKSSLKIAEKLEEFINEIYGDIEEIVFVGDGARGITEVSLNMTMKTTRSIDKFHYTSGFNKLMGINKRSIEKIDGDFGLNLKSKHEFKQKLMSHFTEGETGEIIITEEQRRLLNKLVKGFTKGQLTNKNGGINAVEGVQSHVLSSTFKFKRSFGNKTIFKMLMINCSHYNDGTMTLEKTNSISIDQMYNSDVINNISWCGIDDEQNVPHLKNGISSGLAIMLNRYSH